MSIICLILHHTIITFACTNWESSHGFPSDLRFHVVYWSIRSFYLLTISSLWSSYSWFVLFTTENMLVIFVTTRMSFLTIVILYALIADLKDRYFVLFGFSVSDVLSLVDSLLLESWMEEKVRERTGAWVAGGAFGGIFDWFNFISYIIGKQISPNRPLIPLKPQQSPLSSPWTCLVPSSAYSCPSSSCFCSSSSAH